MTDTAIGFLLIGLGMLVVLGIVFVIASRVSGPPRERSEPPQGVHLPPPSYLPVVMSVGMALLGAGLAFKAEGEVANLWLALPGIGVLVLGIVAWVRAANREWHGVEHGGHGGHGAPDDGAAH
jgi:hypothetical protein